ncbi:MAG: 1-acyl-sn-glycerol-3-phosphate acyltransferase [Rhizobiales bacterium]|nr:1-acyl-sn-glycerol-3-phosphate acyltransferase [Hyphomicrobiales bacterium]
MTILRAALIPVVLSTYVLMAIPVERLVARRAPAARGWTSPWLARLLLALLRIRVEASGLDALRAGTLVVANHVSWIDILVIASLRPMRFLAKAEVGRWPLVAAVARAQGTIFVDRARRRSILPANAAIAAALAAGDVVVVFPEGTTGAGDEALPFRSSHLQPVCDARPASKRIVPLALRYDNSRAAWLGDATLLPHLWEMLRAPPSVCCAVFGAARDIEPGVSRKRLARLMQDQVARLASEREKPSLSP